MDPLLEQFLIESKDLLQEISERFLQLEDSPDDEELINELFRLVHTLKGNSGLFKFPEMTKVLHASEDLLEGVRAGRIKYSTEVADLLLDTMDFVSMLCDEIEAEGDIKNDYAEKASKLSASLRGLIGETNNNDSQLPLTEKSSIGRISVEDLSELSGDLRKKIEDILKDGRSVYHINYVPSDDCFYHGDDPFYLVRQVPELLWCGVETKEKWPELVALDAYRCNLIFKIISTSSLDTLKEHFRYVMECVDIVAIEKKGVQQRVVSQEGTSEATAVEGILYKVLSTQRLILSLQGDSRWSEGKIRAVVKTLVSCCRFLGRDELVPELTRSLDMAIEMHSASPVIEWFDKHMAPCCYDYGKHLQEKKSSGAGEGSPPNRQETSHREKVVSKVLKVNHSKINTLMNLVGEMVVAKNVLPFLASKAEDVYGVRSLGRELKSYYATLNRIVEEMQDAVMKISMVPISSVFRKFPRLVRDIAHRLGKKVELIIEGEETEVNKDIVESLADPLIHIIRNSLDHGIEPPQERTSVGKAPQGTLIIRAVQDSDRVRIEVSDDGRGIDPEKIKNKAYEKGIIDESTLERLTDKEAINLIMTPGFSTAEEVSDLSGRGVGMDVVKNMVERVKGDLQILSEPGKGTKVVLSLPLSMAVTNVMIVMSDGRRFGVPMDTVVETVMVPEKDVINIKDKKATILRDSVMPLFSLKELLHLDGSQKVNDRGELAVLVVSTPSGNAGIVVDDFRETTDVILKPLDGVLSRISIYAGTALLGDGSVLMVLNPKELLRWQ